MAVFTLFDEFIRYGLDGTIDLDTHTFKAVLSNTAPNAQNNTLIADITQIANGNGYTTGGQALTSVTWTETGAGTGIWKWTAADYTWTASGGSIATFQYVIIYDDTPTSPADPLVGYWDYGSTVSITNSNSFTVDIQSGGIFQVQEQ